MNLASTALFSIFKGSVYTRTEDQWHRSRNDKEKMQFANGEARGRAQWSHQNAL